jgi:hypothetical protein
MDWIHFDQHLPHSLTSKTPRVSPASPSIGDKDAPGFYVPKAKAIRVAPPAMMTATPRFPKPMTLWTA